MHRQHQLEAFILLLVVALLAALGFALWRQQRIRELDEVSILKERKSPARVCTLGRGGPNRTEGVTWDGMA